MVELAGHVDGKSWNRKFTVSFHPKARREREREREKREKERGNDTR